MGMSLCACTGKQTPPEQDSGTEQENTTERTRTEEADTGADSTEAPEENGSAQSPKESLPSEEGDVLYVYSWNDDFEEQLQYFKDKYPQYAGRVEYVNLEVGANSGDYSATLETLLQSHYEEAAQYPSIVVLDNSIALDYVQSDYTLPMTGVGIGGEDYQNMYPYTLDYTTYEGDVKALTWYATPGVLCYRADLAEQVLGSGEPEVVQDAVSNWTRFLDTAEKMQEAGYKMVSGPDDVKFPYMDTKTVPWVTDEHLNIDKWVTQYLEMAKKLNDRDYTSGTRVETEEWNANMDKDVFCYFGTPQFYNWALQPELHEGDYRICEGPATFHWGGTWLAVGKECPDTGLAALILRTICCDTDTMTMMGEKTCGFVNNRKAVQSLIDAGKGVVEGKGETNPLPVFDAVAQKVDVSCASVYDTRMNGYVDNVLSEYLSGGDVDTKEAVERIKDQVSDAYNYIKID